jgi:hypothetical protein
MQETERKKETECMKKQIEELKITIGVLSSQSVSKTSEQPAQQNQEQPVPPEALNTFQEDSRSGLEQFILTHERPSRSYSSQFGPTGPDDANRDQLRAVIAPAPNLNLLSATKSTGPATSLDLTMDNPSNSHPPFLGAATSEAHLANNLAAHSSDDIPAPEHRRYIESYVNTALDTRLGPGGGSTSLFSASKPRRASISAQEQFVKLEGASIGKEAHSKNLVRIFERHFLHREQLTIG